MVARQATSSPGEATCNDLSLKCLAGEEEVLKLAEEIPEELNTPLENDTEGSEYFPSVLF